MELKNSDNYTSDFYILSLELSHYQTETEQQFNKEHRRDVSLVQTGFFGGGCISEGTGNSESPARKV